MVEFQADSPSQYSGSSPARILLCNLTFPKVRIYCLCIYSSSKDSFLQNRLEGFGLDKGAVVPGSRQIVISSTALSELHQSFDNANTNVDDLRSAPLHRTFRWHCTIDDKVLSHHQQDPEASSIAPKPRFRSRSFEYFIGLSDYANIKIDDLRSVRSPSVFLTTLTSTSTISSRQELRRSSRQH